MTPQERQLIGELFNRLATLENGPRDSDAEAVIREGFRRAPNAAYALVQSVLVQDEALKAANAHIQELEGANGTPPQPEAPRGFLDSMRDSIFGRDEPRGSVPRVPQGGGAPMGAPGGNRADPWGQPGGSQGGMQGGGYQQGGYQQGGYQQGGYQQGAPMQAPSGGGGGSSFLGTAAAVAAGAIGGSLLMGGIRSALGGYSGSSPASHALDSLGGKSGGSPWSGGGSGSDDLARDAGLNDLRGGGSQSSGFLGGTSQEDQNADDDADADEADDADDGGYDDGGDTQDV